MASLVPSLAPRAWFLLAMVLGIALVLFVDRKNVRRHYFIFYRRTKRGLNLIDRIAKRAPKFWNYYGWAGVVMALISIPAALATMIYAFFKMASTRSVEQGPSFIAPGVTDQVQTGAGISFIPAEYWFVGIGIMMVVHEMSHGIVARAEDFELNSVGWLVLGIIPGAFVEPEGERMLPGAEDDTEDEEDDEEEDETEEESHGIWEQGDWRSRMKVLGAGSFANYLTAFFFFLLATGFLYGVTATETVGFVGIFANASGSGPVEFQAQEGWPAHDAGLRNGTLNSINGQQISSFEEFRSAADGIKPGDQVTIATSNGTVTVEAEERQVRRVRESLEQHTPLLEWFRQLLWIVGGLNLLIGLFNMTPIKPLDGGLIVETLLKRYVSEDAVEYLDSFSLLGWLVLLSAMFLGIILG